MGLLSLKGGEVMKSIKMALASCLVIAMVAGGTEAAMKITPKVQAMIDHHVMELKMWAADPVIVKAIAVQNKKGPSKGMDNGKWKKLRRRSPEVKAFSLNEASKFLQKKQKGSKGMISQLALSAAKGEKVAFVKKPAKYLSKGDAAFDIPLGSGKIWRGKPMLDESIQKHVLLVSAPVLVEGKPAGVLVMGIQLGHLEEMGKGKKMEMKMQH